MNPVLWKPDQDRIKSTNMFHFMSFVNKVHGNKFSNYNDLYQWSIENIERFWVTLWDYLGPTVSKKYEKVLVNGDKMPGAEWFVGARLNFAEKSS